MTLFQSIILGIVQGLTEFLPISSSGHLVIVPYLFGWEIAEQEAFIFDVLVQMGTLVAVIIYFRRDLLMLVSSAWASFWQRQPLRDLPSRMFWYLILATIPAGLVGLLIKDLLERLFSSPATTGGELLVTAALLVLAERTGRRDRSMEQINWKDALTIGLFQAISVLPGISRSGATITGAMLRNLDRPAAARFSFLMSVPVMLAAGGLATMDLLQMPDVMQTIPVVLTGFVVAIIVGYLAIHWLLGYLARHSLYSFAAYCTVAGLVVLISWWL